MRVWPPTRTTRVLHALLARLDGAANDVRHHRFEFRTAELLDEVLRTGRVGRDERQIDFGLLRRGQLDFGAFRSVTKTLQSHLIALGVEVEAFVFLEFFDEPIDDALVDVVAAQVRVAVGSLHFDDAFTDFQNGNVEGAAAEVVDRDDFVFLLVETVGESRRRGFVDDALHVETGDLAGVFRGDALGVVEVRRNGDDRFGDLLAEEVFRRELQLSENHRGDLRRSVFLAVRENGNAVTVLDDFIGDHLHFFADFVEAAPHEALDGINRVFRIGDCLPLGHLANEAFTGLGYADDRRSSPRAFLVGDDLRLATLHNRDHGVRGAQVNTDNLTHECAPMRPAGEGGDVCRSNGPHDTH
jgi:hypothetical protein